MTHVMNFQVSTQPSVIVAKPGADGWEAIMYTTLDNGGSWFPVVIQGLAIALNASNTMIFVAVPGTYQMQWEDDAVEVRALSAPPGSNPLLGLVAATQGEGSGAGVPGAPGPQGAAGTQGAPGVQGAKGDQGPQGGSGAQGSQGGAGTQGSQGSQGERGAQGEVGAQGDTGGPGPQGLPGEQGPQGAQGPQG